MTRYKIIEAADRRDIRRFVRFPDDLYRNCGQYVPPLHKDQINSLTKVSTLSYCKRKMWLALDGKKIVGRKVHTVSRVTLDAVPLRLYTQIITA